MIASLIIYGLLVLIYSGVTKSAAEVLPAKIIGLVLVVLGIVLPLVR